MNGVAWRLVTYNFPPGGGGVSRYYGGLASADSMHCEVVAPATSPRFPPGEGPTSRLRQSVFVRRAAVADKPVMFGHPHLALSSLITGRPFGLFIHGGEWSDVPRGAELLRAVMTRARLVVVNSQATRQRFTPNLTDDTCVVIRPGVATSFFTTDTASAECSREPLELLIVSRLVPRKRVLETVRMLVPLLQRRLVRLNVVGEGAQAGDLGALCASLSGLDLRWHRHVDDDALQSLYRSAHVFVFCPMEIGGGEGFEGFGMVLLEAAAAGCAIVTTQTGGTLEAINPEGATVLHALEELPLAIEKMLHRRSKVVTMGAVNRVWAATNTWRVRVQVLQERLRAW